MDNSIETSRSTFWPLLLLCLTVSLVTTVLLEVISGRADAWIGLWPDDEQPQPAPGAFALGHR
ncbi:hypothetical protein [Pseudomonas sp. SBB6]|uniref:hypothetical protein n=1 Tax=Pseudomonas sp. SBB6 TaxID=2962032 RepID=UPI0020B89286|nr:hypothetical protein [Pseudomonas sp. SBB6]MCP3753258.1 hypothetical protein [Pseudomonas sp. SBB6]